MTFRHVVMFRWAEETAESDREAAIAALRAFGEQVTDLGRLQVGVDAAVAAGNFDAVVIVDFPDADAYRRYVADPRHVEVVARYVLPFLAVRAAVQTELA